MFQVIKLIIQVISVITLVASVYFSGKVLIAGFNSNAASKIIFWRESVSAPIVRKIENDESLDQVDLLKLIAQQSLENNFYDQMFHHYLLGGTALIAVSLSSIIVFLVFKPSGG